MKTLNLIFFLFQSLLICQTYYVDSFNGSDSNSGTKIYQAWKSIKRVNNVNLKPGDKVLFNKNCTWREELRIPSNGSEENRIYFGTYGTGDAPKILGSDRISIWLYLSNNIWKSPFKEKVGWLWFSEHNDSIVWGNRVEEINMLQNEYDFYLDSNNVLIFSEGNPNDNYKSVEMSVRDFGIVSGWYSKGKSNIEIYGIEIAFAKIANLRAVGSANWRVSNIISHHSGEINESDGQGIQFEGNNSQFIKNVLYENGQHGFFLSSFGNANIYNIIIEENEVYNNYHTAIDLMNDGGSQESFKEVIVTRNLIYDTPNFSGREVGIQLLGYGDGFLKNIKVHHNIILNLSVIGISILKNSQNIFVHNNTILKTNSSCINIDNLEAYAEVYNNIGVNNNYYAVLFVHNTTNKLVDNNIWFVEDDTDTRNVFIMGNYYNSILDYRKGTGFDVNGYFSDPNLLYRDNRTVELKSSSIAIDAGKSINYKIDYYGNKILNKIDIGAVEFQKD